MKNSLIIYLSVFFCFACNSTNKVKMFDSNNSDIKDTLINHSCHYVTDGDCRKTIFTKGNIECILEQDSLFEYKDDDSNMYYSCKILKEGEIAHQIDSVLAIGNLKYKKEIMYISCITYQNEDLSTQGNISYFNMKTGDFGYICTNLINSECFLINNNASLAYYMSSDTLYEHDFKHQTTIPLVSFDNPMMYSVKLFFDHNKIRLIFYQDFNEDIINKKSPKVATIWEM